MEVRKVQRLGSSSLIITLPKSWINKVGIRAGDSVYIIEKEKELRVIPFESEEGFGVEMRISAKDPIEVLETKLKCALYSGLSTLFIKSDEPISEDMLNTIEKIVEIDRDYEIRERTPFSVKLALVRKLTEEDLGAIIRESMSILESSVQIILEFIKSGKPEDLEKLEKNQILMERRRLNRKHLFRMIEQYRGDLSAERKTCLKILSSFNICQGIMSIHETLYKIMKTFPREEIVFGIDERTLVESIISEYLNMLWEIVGAVTNESEKRLESAKEKIESIENQFVTRSTLEKLKNPLAFQILSLIYHSLSYMRRILDDMRCSILLKELEMKF